MSEFKQGRFALHQKVIEAIRNNKIDLYSFDSYIVTFYTKSLDSINYFNLNPGLFHKIISSNTFLLQVSKTNPDILRYTEYIDSIGSDVQKLIPNCEEIKGKVDGSECNFTKFYPNSVTNKLIDYPKNGVKYNSLFRTEDSGDIRGIWEANKGHVVEKGLFIAKKISMDIYL